MTRKSGKLVDKDRSLYQPIKSTEYLLSLANLATGGKLSTLCPSLNLYDNLYIEWPESGPTSVFPCCRYSR